VIAVVSAMGGATDSLLDLANSLATVPDARELDLLLSTGEQASAAALAMALGDLGVPARSFTGRDAGIVTDGIHGYSSIIDVDPLRIRDCVHAGVVPVVTGFQGIAPDRGELTTLGRGGSDTTAVALAAALRAEVCEIFTDVDGVFTADPRLVAGARKVNHLCYEDMIELAACGATVLAHSSVEYARTHRVPIHVRPTTADTAGTWVTGSRHDGAEPEDEPCTVVGIAHQTGQLCCRLDRVDPGALTAFAAAFSGPNRLVDMLDYTVADPPTSVCSLRFTASAGDRHVVEEVLADLRAAGAFDTCDWSGPVGKVSLVGRGFRTRPPSVPPLVREALETHRVDSRDVMVRPRRISFTCVERDVGDVVTHLHRRFVVPGAEMTVRPRRPRAGEQLLAEFVEPAKQDDLRVT
jgi:aspartate kinase